MNKINKISSCARGGCDLAATAQKNDYLPHGYASSDQLKALSSLSTFDADCQLIDTYQLADTLGIQAETIIKARSTKLGDFPNYIKFGRCVRYRKKDVAAWLERHVQAFDGEVV